MLRREPCDGAWNTASAHRTEARGIAESNRIIAGSFTREYLQHEANQALLKFAESDNASTVILPAGMAVTPLIDTPQPSTPTPKAVSSTP